MTISYTSNVVVYTGNGATTVFPIPYYWLSDSHIFVTRITIASGARTVATLGLDYTLSGAGNLAGGQCTMLSVLSSLYQLEIKRIVPLVQQVDFVAHDTFPAETMERGLDYQTMINQQQDTRLTALEATGAGSAITLQNVGAGSGIYTAQVGSTYQLKSLVAGTGISFVVSGTDITLNSTFTGLTYNGAKYQFLRGDGAFAQTVDLGAATASAAPVTTATSFKFTYTAAPTDDVIEAIRFTKSNGAANQKHWGIFTSENTFEIGPLDDSLNFLSGGSNGIQIRKTAGQVDRIRGPSTARWTFGGYDDGVSFISSQNLALNTPLGISSGGTGQSTAQAAINILSNVAAASVGQVLQRVGANAVFAAAPGSMAVISSAYAATLTVDLTAYFTYPFVLINVGTLTGNILFNLTNGAEGQIIRVRFQQDGTGNRLFSAGGNLRFSADTPLPALSTGAGKIDRMAFEWNVAGGKADLLATNLGY